MDYYNEIDPYAAQWLRNLIDAGHIAPGWVDTRSIEDVKPNELTEFRRCHFFAGIGGWALALEIAGWPSDRRVWTGSCPCQPFSAAGKGDGFADERHLWPAWQHLIAQCNPSVIFGEQVASKAVDAWIDLVHADLEGMGYRFGSIPFPAAGIGAPHIRDRNYWVADASGQGPSEQWRERIESARLAPDSVPHGMAHPELVWLRSEGSESPPGEARGVQAADGERERVRPDAGASGASVHERMADARSEGFQERERFARIPRGAPGPSQGEASFGGSVRSASRGSASPTNGQWGAADWLCCTDGKWRPVEPGTFPLAHGLSGRVGRLRAYGNAIVPAQAAEFIGAYLDTY